MRFVGCFLFPYFGLFGLLNFHRHSSPSPPLPTVPVAATRLCDVAITAESAEEFLYAVENHYWFQMYLGASIETTPLSDLLVLDAVLCFFLH